MGLKCSVFLCSAIALCLADEWQDHEVRYLVQPQYDHGGHEKYHDSHHLSKHHNGGFKKGHDHWDQGEFGKQAKKWGSSGKNKHGMTEEHGEKHHKKHGLNQHGEKWAKKSGEHKKGHFDEWKSKEHHNIDKGSGYIKKWDWHKEKGAKEANGKKGGHEESHHKKAHGQKESLKKHHDEAAKKHGYKDHHAKKEWKDHGKKMGEKGHHKKSGKSWEEKLPAYKTFKNYLKEAVHKPKSQHYY